jgi:hypothetical protein
MLRLELSLYVPLVLLIPVPRKLLFPFRIGSPPAPRVVFDSLSKVLVLSIPLSPEQTESLHDLRLSEITAVGLEDGRPPFGSGVTGAPINLGLLPLTIPAVKDPSLPLALPTKVVTTPGGTTSSADELFHDSYYTRTLRICNHVRTMNRSHGKHDEALKSFPFRASEKRSEPFLSV